MELVSAKDGTADRTAVAPASRTATNDTNGKIKFEKLIFTKPGVYQYAVTETTDSGNGITKDSSVYTVTYTVRDDGEGKLQLLGQSVAELLVVFFDAVSLGSPQLLVDGKDALELIADKAIQRATGARGLRSIMESVMLNIMYDAPSMEGLCKVIIDKECIENGSDPQYIIDDSKEKSSEDNTQNN